MKTALLPTGEETAESFSTLRSHPELRNEYLPAPTPERKDFNAWLYDGLTTHGLLLAQALEGRLGRLLRYMSDVSSGEAEERAITPAMANRALLAWAELWNATGFAVSVPDAGPADDGHMVFAWNREEHYLELEIFHDDRCEMFYRNRSTAQLWSAEYRIGEEIPSEVLEKLGIFTA